MTAGPIRASPPRRTTSRRRGSRTSSFIMRSTPWPASAALRSPPRAHRGAAAAEVNPAGGGSDLKLARTLALLVPAALLAGGWGSQIWGGLFPCEMCWWQRYAHIAALVLAVGALVTARQAGLGRALLVLAALAIL